MANQTFKSIIKRVKPRHAVLLGGLATLWLIDRDAIYQWGPDILYQIGFSVLKSASSEMQHQAALHSKEVFEESQSAHERKMNRLSQLKARHGIDQSRRR